jgi:hypothetical protein
MRWYLKSIIFLCLCITPVLALTQEDCPAIIQAALDATDQQCAATGRNQACYGNIRLDAEPQAGMETLVFEKPGDLVDIANVRTLTLSPWDEAESTWGISLMKLQANLPDTLPGQNVSFLLFGNVSIDNAVASNTEGPSLQVTANGSVDVYSAPSAENEAITTLADRDSATALGRSEDSTWLLIMILDGRQGWVLADQVKADDSFSFLDVIDAASALTSTMTPMQAFYFQTGLADAPCAEAPDSGILVQTPEGSGDISFTANEVNISLGSTVYLQAQPSGDMTVSVVEGQAEVTALNETRIVPAGALVRIPLDANRAASAPPGEVDPYTDRDIQGLPVGILERVITVAAPLAEGEATPEATSNAAADTAQDVLLTPGRWQVMGEWLDCDVPPGRLVTLPYDLTFEVDSSAGTINFRSMPANVRGPTHERVEDGVYRSESETHVGILTILSPDHFTALTTFAEPNDLGCSMLMEDYTLVSAME